MSMLRARTRIARWGGQVSYRGLVVPLDLGVVPDAVIEQLIGNRYEVPEIVAMLSLLRPDDRLLELGSGLGVTSTLAARALPQGRVWTVEANPCLADQIRSVHDANGVHNVERWSGAVTHSDEAGAVDFHLHEMFPESSIRRSEQTVDVVSVPLIAWSQVMRDFAPSVLVCDIEGAEGELIPRVNLAGIRAVVVELHPQMLTHEEVRAVVVKLFDDGFVPRFDLWSGAVAVFERAAAPE